MSERLPSDSDAIVTHRAELIRLGGTRTQCLRLPDAVGDDIDEGDRLTLIFGGDEYYSLVESDARGQVVRGAFDNRRLARTPTEGTNRLGQWLRELRRETGNSVEIDVVVAGEQYGLRAPGERAVYTVKQGPRDSLASIAEQLDGDR